MSQRVVRYEGEGKRRRPVYLDEGPASASIQRQIGEGKTSLLDGIPARELGGAGPIERRYVSEAERAVRVVARPLGPSAGERMQASRRRGAERHVEVMAARKVPEEQEERTMAEEPTRHKSFMPAAIPGDEPQPLDTFQELAAAAAAASEAWARRQAADIAWEVAQEGLEEVLGEVYAILHPPPDHLPAQSIPLSDGTIMRAHSDGQPETIAALRELGEAIIAHPPEPEPKSEPRSRVGEGQRPGQASARDHRAAMVMEAMARLGDDKKAVAAELGMKTNAVAMVVKFASKRAGAGA